MSKVSITLSGLACDKTTERSADEVYILVSGVRSDGVTHSARLPTDNGYWNMNDGSQQTDNPNGDSHIITNRLLFSSDLPIDQAWNLVFILMEEDGGTTVTPQQITSALLKNSGNPYLIAVGGILNILTSLGVYKKDTDDYIGSFGVCIQNTNGNISAQWSPKDNVIDDVTPQKDPNVGPNGHGFRMNGDGSNYFGWYRLDVVHS